MKSNTKQFSNGMFLPQPLKSGVCVCCLASNGTNLYGMMMYGG